MPEKTAVQVRVSMVGPGGRPVAEVLVPGSITAHQLGSALQKVTTSEEILKLAGLRACGGCKSGLDLHIIDHHQEVVRFEV